MSRLKEFKFSTVIRHSDYIVKHHTVHGVQIMPGVTFIDIVYRALKLEGIEPANVELRNVLFKEPIVTTEGFDRKVELYLITENEKQKIISRSIMVKDDQPLESDWTEHFECEAGFAGQKDFSKLDYQSLISSSFQNVDMDEAYEIARRVDIRHFDFMKVAGEVYGGDRYLLANIHLSDLAQEYLPYSEYHPAYLDSSTLVPFLFRSNHGLATITEKDVRPFIPLHIEKVTVQKRIADQCWVYMNDVSSQLSPSGEIFTQEIHIYNEAGDLAVHFEKLSYKKVRSKELLQKLESPEVKLGKRTSDLVSVTPGTINNGTELVSSNSTNEQESSLVEQVERELQHMIADMLQVDASMIQIDDGFYDQGLNSVDLLKLVQNLEKKINQQLYPTLLFEYSNIGQLANYLASKFADRFQHLGLENQEIALEQSRGSEQDQLFYYHPEYRLTPFSKVKPDIQSIVIFDQDEQLIQEYEQMNRSEFGVSPKFILVKYGQTFKELAAYRYEINPTSKKDFITLLTHLNLSNHTVTHMIVNHAHRQHHLELPKTDIRFSVQRSLSFLHVLTQSLMENSKTDSVHHLVYLYSSEANSYEKACHDAIQGYIKVLNNESPKFKYCTIELKETEKRFSPLQLLQVLRDLQLHHKEVSLQYVDEKRFALKYRNMVPHKSSKSKISVKNRGVYLITGGAGGIGWHVTEYIMSVVDSATIILVGRSPLSQRLEDQIKRHKKKDIALIYRQVDLANEAEVYSLMEEVKKKYGRIYGIFHSAGVVRDGFIINKSIVDMEEVIASKVYGTTFLDEATKHEPIDFFVLFSSLSVALGNAGQSDYAFANRFMESFAFIRNELVEKQQRSGKTIAISWPLWNDGGMNVDEFTKANLRQKFGMVPLSTDFGVEALEQALLLSLSQVLVFYGDRKRLEQALDISDETESSINEDLDHRAQEVQVDQTPSPVQQSDEIAIIGVSGRYPHAANLSELWENLKAGKDCISPVSKRWANQPAQSAHDGQTQAGNWGGFLNDIDTFDPLFFNISPKEAEQMDPQERLFMETVQHTLEDAGYTKSRLSGEKVGVFVGAMWGQYQLLFENTEDDAIPTSVFASIANRVSYFYNFTGPSIAVDTMCSSSLTSLHLACASIKSGESRLAIAGGVNVTIHPHKYNFLLKQQFLSSDGRCRAFGEDGDGYVPGEGVGAVLLKPLSQAIKDKDQIYAVIKGSAVNHGGKTGGYTIPSPVSQADVILEAFRTANVDPETISYIEAHGTGTSLGDPIEIEGLTRAFESSQVEKQSCAIGSIKSNIGHLESAAGIAGITKVLLQLKHKTIVPSLHSRELNKQINFLDTPFYVQRELAPWHPRTDTRDGALIPLPRRASVSSFGAGGANAHVILEEYISAPQQHLVSNQRPYLIILSAKTKAALIEYTNSFYNYVTDHAVDTSEISNKLLHLISTQIKTMISDVLDINPASIDPLSVIYEFVVDPVDQTFLVRQLQEKFGIPVEYMDLQYSIQDLSLMWIRGHYNTLVSLYFGSASHVLELSNEAEFLDALSYTLQTGREQFEFRLAFTVHSLGELQDKLRSILYRNAKTEGVYEGHVQRKQRQYTMDTLPSTDLAELMKSWIEGTDINWALRYQKYNPMKISLPTYPFAKERYWVSNSKQSDTVASIRRLHPLIDENVSTIEALSYIKKYSIDERYVSEHVINGIPVLPGVITLEMARVAYQLAHVQSQSRAITIKNLKWTSPIRFAERQNQELKISLYPLDDGMQFDIKSADQDFVYAYGSFASDSAAPVPVTTVTKAMLKERMASCITQISKEDFYKRLEQQGYQYGPIFQSLSELYCSEHELVACILSDADEVNGPVADEYLQIPRILDGALQTVAGFLYWSDNADVYLPASVGQITIVSDPTDARYIYIKRRNEDGNRFDILLVNKEGNLVVSIVDFHVVQTSRLVSYKNLDSMTYYTNIWKEMKLAEQHKAEEVQELILFMQQDELGEQISQYLSGKGIRVIKVYPGKHMQEVEQGAFIIEPSDSTNYKKLFEILVQRKHSLKHILFLWSTAPFAPLTSLAEQTKNGILAIFHISKALLRVKDVGSSRLLCAFPLDEEKVHPLNSAISSFSRSLYQENPSLQFKTVQFKYEDIFKSLKPGVDVLLRELITTTAGFEVLIRNNKRFIKVPEKVENRSLTPSTLPFKEKGVYMVTGGAKGIGQVFVKYMINQSPMVNIILVGRSPLSAKISAFLHSLSGSGQSIEYVQADIANYHEASSMIQAIKRKHGQINGVIHSAGLINDSFLLKKEEKDFLAVLEPKVQGSIWLDELTKHEPLDFFVMFSSAVSIVGNIGQTDYAYANAFMDYFAEWRAGNKRPGKSLALNWPLWASGGMNVNQNTAQHLTNMMGIQVLQEEDGIQAFEHCIAASHVQLMTLKGDDQKIANYIESVYTKPKVYLDVDDDDATGADVKHRLISHLKALLSTALKLPESRIDEEENFEAYGIDSVMIMEMTRKLESDFGELSKTLFFEYSTLNDLAEHLLRTKREAVSHLFVSTARKKDVEGYNDRRLAVEFSPSVQKQVQPDEDIAIIGLSGEYPMAQNIEEYWGQLSQGTDCISEIPNERWDHSKSYDPTGTKKGSTYSKWGGFISDMSCFDPLFFNISPKEAKAMDPQERRFLQIAWGALEDAGYNRVNLKNKEVGVFVGAMYGHYQMYGAEQTLLGKPMALTSSYASIANRVSFFLDLHGPSLAIDTMCSSSLTAIHLACDSILKGDCEMGIAGGVNLHVHPNKYLLLSEGKFVSQDGRCRSFGKDGDGYVPSEGVGAVILKRLTDAIQDGDQIYAVIKSSSMNHGGRTNGYTVPNPNAQAQVIMKALKKANIDPRTISYIEAHGTGTALGDPIEIKGLSQAFESFTSDKQFCAIGSVKSNIGHAESAAGIAAMTKVILQMKHQRLVPSIHSDVLNPNIKFEDTPFYVQKELTMWEEAKQIIDGREQMVPRRAGISSFGAGGTNVHLILEEYKPEQRTASLCNQACLFVLSAKNEERLREYAERFLQYLDRKNHSQVHLSDLAYTVQVKREAMEERFAVVVSSLSELRGQLLNFLDRKADPAYFSGNSRADAARVRVQQLEEDKNWANQMKHAIQNRDFSLLAQWWSIGVAIDWQLLYVGQRPMVLSLPTYPFLKREYWYDREKSPFSELQKTENHHVFAKKSTTPATEAKYTVPLIPYEGDEVKLEVIHGCLALIRLEDRKSKNTFSQSLIHGLMSRFEEIRKNPQIKALIITGYENVFCMGGTQEALTDMVHDKISFTDAPFLYEGMLKIDIPVIAAIQGHASGGGLLFGLYADIIIMAEESIYSAVFMKYGFTPGMGATYLLKEKLGQVLAQEMMFTAKSYQGVELKNRGANLLFKKRKDVLEEAISIGKHLIDIPINALRVLKKELASRTLEQLPHFIAIEEEMHKLTFHQPEVQERIDSYYQVASSQAEPAHIELEGIPPKEQRHKGKLKLKATSAFASQSHTTETQTVEADINELGLEAILRQLERREITPEEGLELKAKLRKEK